MIPLRRLTLLFCLLLLFIVPASAEWWNSSWYLRSSVVPPDSSASYQWSVNISNATGTNNATHLFCNGFCNVNFTDIRFIVGNSSEMNYCIETPVDTWTRVWLNKTINGTIYWYFKNPNATTTTSSCNSTVPLYDDFLGSSLNSTLWNTYGNGTNAVYGGEMHVVHGPEPGRDITSKSTYANGTFLRARAKTGNATLGPWYVGYEKYVGATYPGYMVSALYYAKGSTYFTPQKYFLSTSGSGTRYTMLEWATLENSSYHTAEVRRGGTNDTFSFNDTEFLEATNPVTTAMYISMHARISDVTVDWIMLGTLPPAGTAWPSWGVNITEASLMPYIPPTPVLDAVTTGNFWVNTSWTPGAGNITNKYNVLVNGIWVNGTTATYINSTLTPHGWHNVSVYAVNSSGGDVMSSALENNTQVPNNAPVQQYVWNKKVYPGELLSIQITATDTDNDTLTYGTNAANGTLNTTSGLFTWTPAAGEVGNYSWYFNVTDGYITPASPIQSLFPGINIITIPDYLISWELGEEAVVGNPLTVSPVNCITQLSYGSEVSNHISNWGWQPEEGSESFTSLSPNTEYLLIASDACTLTYNLNTSQIIPMQVKSPVNISISLTTAGWNTAIINATQTMSSLNDLFSPTYISSWNSSSQSWIKYKSGWTYRSTDTVEKDQAVMILVSSNKNISVYLNTSPAWNMRTGQNLLGVPEAMTLSQINATVNYGVGCANVDEITYSEAGLADKTFTCINGNSQTNASESVPAGHGVWMNAVQNINITNIG